MHPLDLPTPALSNAMTRRSRASRFDERGIPVVEIASEVLEQYERDITLADLSVGILDPVCGRDAFMLGA